METSEEEKEGGSPEEKKESESPEKEEEPAAFNPYTPYMIEDHFVRERRGTFTAGTAPLVDEPEKVEYFQMVNGAKKFVYAPSPKSSAKKES